MKKIKLVQKLSSPPQALDFAPVRAHYFSSRSHYQLHRKYDLSSLQQVKGPRHLAIESYHGLSSDQPPTTFLKTHLPIGLLSELCPGRRDMVQAVRMRVWSLTLGANQLWHSMKTLQRFDEITQADIKNCVTSLLWTGAKRKYLNYDQLHWESKLAHLLRGKIDPKLQKELLEEAKFICSLVQDEKKSKVRHFGLVSSVVLILRAFTISQAGKYAALLQKEHRLSDQRQLLAEVQFRQFVNCKSHRCTSIEQVDRVLSLLSFNKFRVDSTKVLDSVKLPFQSELKKLIGQRQIQLVGKAAQIFPYSPLVREALLSLQRETAKSAKQLRKLVYACCLAGQKMMFLRLLDQAFRSADQATLLYCLIIGQQYYGVQADALAKKLTVKVEDVPQFLLSMLAVSFLDCGLRTNAVQQLRRRRPKLTGESLINLHIAEKRQGGIGLPQQQILQLVRSQPKFKWKLVRESSISGWPLAAYIRNQIALEQYDQYDRLKMGRLLLEAGEQVQLQDLSELVQSRVDSACRDAYYAIVLSGKQAHLLPFLEGQAEAKTVMRRNGVRLGWVQFGRVKDGWAQDSARSSFWTSCNGGTLRTRAAVALAHSRDYVCN